MWLPSDSSSEGFRQRATDAAGATLPSSQVAGVMNRGRSRWRSKSGGRSSSCSPPGPKRRLLGSVLQQPLPHPVYEPGTDWWAPALCTMSEHLRRQRPTQSVRPMTHQSLLSGMATEVFVAKALGIRMETLSTCDVKPSSRKWISTVFGTRCGHSFERFEHVADENAAKAPCTTHDDQCPVEVVDLATIGLCCQPFSVARDQRQVAPRMHPLYGITFETFPMFLKAKRPRGWIAEQVLGFGRVDPDDDQGRSYLTQFIVLTANLGYSVRAFSMEAGIWSECDRGRYPISGDVAQGFYKVNRKVLPPVLRRPVFLNKNSFDRPFVGACGASDLVARASEDFAAPWLTSVCRI